MLSIFNIYSTMHFIDMAKASVKKNFIYNYINQVINVVVPFLLTPYLSRALGVDGVGEFSFAFSIVTYFVLAATLGTDVYAQREISYNQDDKKNLNILFYELLLLRLILVIVATLAYFVLIIIFKLSLIYIILVLNIINISVDLTWFYTGLEKINIVCIRNIIIKILNAILIFLCVKVPSDLNIYSFIMAGCTVLSSIILWFNLSALVDLKIPKKLNAFRHLKSSLALFIPTIAIYLYTIFDKTLIGIFAKTYTENGYYEQANKVVNIALKLVTALAFVMMPRIAYLKSKNDDKEIKRYFDIAVNYIWFVTLPMAFMIFALAPNAVPWFFGEDFNGSIVVLQVLSPLVVIIGLSNLIGIQYLLPVKKDKVYISSVVLGAIVNLFFNFILIPRYFSVGAAIATIIGEISVTTYQMYHIRKEINILNLLSKSLTYLAASIIMFIVLTIFARNFSPSFANSLIILFIGAFIYILILLAFRDKFLISNIKRVYER